MKKFFSLLILFTFFTTFISLNHASAQVTCNAKVIVHYHRYDANYEGYEFHIWDNGSLGTQAPVQMSETDDFGGVATITVCSDAKDEMGLIPKEDGTWNKDGVDADNNGDIDDKKINLVDIRGTSKTVHVYVMQGADDVYYQNPLDPTYFGKPGFGNVVVVYYNPGGNEGWDDFWTWGTGTGAKGDDIIFNYGLGMSGGTDPNLFNVGVINIASDADDQIGFVVRKDRSWDEKDAGWAGNLAAEESDDNGHTYKPNGDRLINVSDVKGSGFKFIYVIYGHKTLYEDFDEFAAEAFKLEFTKAEFRSPTTLSISLSQNIAYGATGPNANQFVVKDADGKTVPIDKITFNSLVTSDKNFNIVLQDDISEGKTYTVTYNFEQFGQQKTTSKEATFAEGIEFPEVVEEAFDYTGLIIAGVVLLGLVGVGIAFMARRRR